MKLLLLNTCGADASVALADPSFESLVVVEQRMPGRTASERVVGSVREMLTAAGWQLSDLRAIAVVDGPGSFTGVRVGLSVAKGLSEASGVPLIAISRLALLAAASGQIDSRICALLDAGREEFYCGEYLGTESLGEVLLSRDDAFTAVRRAGQTVVCEEALFQAFEDLGRVRMVAEPTAADAFPLALKRLESSDFDDAERLDANYLRRTDAEIFAKPAVTRVK